MILRDIIYFDKDHRIKAGKELLNRNQGDRYFLIGNLITIIENIPILRLEAALILLRLNPSKLDLHLIIDLVPEYRIQAGKQLIALHDIDLSDANVIKSRIPELWNKTKKLILIQEKKANKH